MVCLPISGGLALLLLGVDSLRPEGGAFEDMLASWEPADLAPAGWTASDLWRACKECEDGNCRDYHCSSCDGGCPSMAQAFACCENQADCSAVYGGGEDWWTFHGECIEVEHAHQYAVYHNPASQPPQVVPPEGETDNPVIDFVGDVVDVAIGVGNGGAQAGIDLVGGTASTAMDVAGAVADGAADAVGSAASVATDVADEIADGTADVLDSIIDTSGTGPVVDTAAQVTGAVVDAAAQGVDVAASVATKVADTVGDVGSGAFDLASDASDAVADVAGQAVDNAASAAMNVAGEVTDAASDVVNSVFSRRRRRKIFR